MEVRWDEAGSRPASAMPETRSKKATQRALPAKRPSTSTSKQKVANPSLPGSPGSTPTCSEGTIDSGAKERLAVRNVALDLGTKKTTYCEVADGAVVQRATVSEIESLQCLLGPDHKPARVAIEACREAWLVHDLLTSWGNEVLLVDTTRSKQLGIGRHGRKNDRIDAEVMARAVERGGIPVAHLLSPHRRQLRRWLGVRRALVETRAQLITTLRGLAREQGVKIPGCHPPNFYKVVRSKVTDPELVALLDPGLATLEALEPQIETTEQQISQLCAEEPMVEVLTTLPGVAGIVSASFISVIDDAQRFRRAHEVESYLGLVPSEDTTGGRRRIGAISKQGNAYLRALMVQAAWTFRRVASPEDPLRRWVEAVSERRGTRVAIVALARRLTGVLWAMWRDGESYDPKRVAGKHPSRGHDLHRARPDSVSTREVTAT